MQDYNLKVFDHWIPISKIQTFIQMETFIVLLILGLSSWLFYRVFLQEISPKRHLRLKVQYRRVFTFWTLGAMTSFLFWVIQTLPEDHSFFFRLGAYLALCSILISAVTLIFIAQLLVYVYLFFNNMNVGVPRLIVNIFTLVFGTCVFGCLSSEIFGLALMPLLATSAVFSLVLGLALQDTLGNLFSGVALQLERPFNIGDWVEIYTGTYHWIGQIQEINWRATLILSYSDELISLPNKTMAQSQILVVSNELRAPRRNQCFYFPHNINFKAAKEVIYNATLRTTGVLAEPEPVILSLENNPSWVVVKVFYSIDNFSRQYRIGDQVFINGLLDLNKAQIPLARPTIEVFNEQMNK